MTDGLATKTRFGKGETGEMRDMTEDASAGMTASMPQDGTDDDSMTGCSQGVMDGDATADGLRSVTAGKELTSSEAATGESRSMAVGLDDGTPGCEGVCGKGYDPRFDRKSDQFQKFGFIYKITCLVNGKVYIGQTTRSVRKRWRCHVDESRYKSPDRLNPIDYAILKYGEDNFRVETIEKVLDEYLGIREQYWIRHYDCCTLDGYDKGYNASRGGDPNRRYILDEDEIVLTYQMGCSLPWMMFVLQICTIDPIRNVLVKHGVPIRNHSLYNSSDLPECIMDAYYHNTGKTRRASLSHHSKASSYKRKNTPRHQLKSLVEDIPILVAQFDSTLHFVQVMHSYREMVDWALASGTSQNSHRQSLIAHMRKTVLPSQPYAVYQMLHHYWVVLHDDDDINSPSTLTKCEKALMEYVSSQDTNSLRWFDENINEVILAILGSSTQAVAKQLGITDTGLQKRLKMRSLPYRTLDLFRYAIDNHLIDDPIGDMKEAIHTVFTETNSLEQTEAICGCSQDDIYFACKYYGLSPSTVNGMRKKAPGHPVRPVLMYRSDGTYLCAFPNIPEASRYSDIPQYTIWRSCHNRNIQAPYYFRFADEEGEPTPPSEQPDLPDSPSDPS